MTTIALPALCPVTSRTQTARRRSRRIALWLAQGGVCRLCRTPIRQDDIADTSVCVVDHIIPKARGGSWMCWSNLHLLCVPCDAGKGDAIGVLVQGPCTEPGHTRCGGVA